MSLKLAAADIWCNINKFKNVYFQKGLSITTATRVGDIINSGSCTNVIATDIKDIESTKYSEP